MNVTWADGHVTEEHQGKIEAGANSEVDWYYMADK